MARCIRNRQTVTTFDLTRLLKPKSLAVVGASARSDSYGAMVLNKLLGHRYPGSIYPINPKRDELFGLTCYPDLSSVPGPVDLIYVAVPGPMACDILREAGRIGVGGAAIPGSGFADGGPEGIALQNELVAVAAEVGIPICGPNNMGFINYNDRVLAWPTYIPPIEQEGKIALISHSGSVGIAMTQDGRGLNFAYCISAGNEANVGAADYLRFCAEDDQVEVVLLFLETIRNPVAFAEAASFAREKGKPIAVVKVGRSETASRMVSAHTGSLAGEDALYDAFFRRLGIVRVPDLDTLAEAGVLLSSGMHAPPDGPVMLVMLSGGEGALAADLCSDNGIELPELAPATLERLRPFFPSYATPRNPIDGYGLGWNPESFESILKAIESQEDFGTLALCMDSAAEGFCDDGMVAEMADMCARIKPRTTKSIVYINNTWAAGMSLKARERFELAGIPALLGSQHGFSAMGSWIRVANAEQSPIGGQVDEGLVKAVSSSLSEADRLELLRQHDVPMVDTHVVESAGDAATAICDFGQAVVMKGTAPSLLHKTEHGLVEVNITSAEAARATFEKLSQSLAETLPAEADRQILMQPMVREGVELILGATYYPGFGMLVVVGLGGTLVEVLKSASTELAPISENRARHMLGETPAATLISGARGKGPYDLEAAVAAVVAFSEFAASVGSSLQALEINPLIVLQKGQGVLGVDAVFETTADTK